MPPRRSIKTKDSKNVAAASKKKKQPSTTTTTRSGGKKKNDAKVNDENLPPQKEEEETPVKPEKTTLLGGRLGRARRTKKQVNYHDTGGDTEPESSDDDGDGDDEPVVEVKAGRGKKRGGAAKGKKAGKSTELQQPKAKKQKFLPSPPAIRPADNHTPRAIVGRDIPSPEDDWRCFGMLDY